MWEAIAAQTEAAFGNSTAASSAASQALKLAPGSQAVQLETALAFALAGNASRAKSLAQDLAAAYPLDTQMLSLWIPSIHAQLELNHRNSASAFKSRSKTSPPTS